MPNSAFTFKHFNIKQDKCAMKVGTDAVLLGAWVQAPEATSILDIGTGTGVIALMLAQKTKANIIGIEIDLSSATQAQENVKESLFHDQIQIIHHSLQEFTRISKIKFQVIVSNPPFFEQSLKSFDEKRSNARHTDVLPFEELIESVLKLLDVKGKFCLILPVIEAEKFRALAQKKGLQLSKLLRIKSRAGKEFDKRHLMQFEFSASEFSEDTLIIEEDERHNYTKKYKDFTKDYYVNF